jgi:hypothetical protein
MNYKFTPDGKKVIVVGALNTKETIVQEVFVIDGTEFPAGEHFIAKTLLDAPADTYKVTEERRVERRVKELEATCKKLESEISNFRYAARAAFEKVKWVQGITSGEVDRVFERIKSVICGEYTHIVFFNYNGFEIKEWNAELFSKKDDSGRFAAIRLVSLYGYWNGRLELDWRMNEYADGSGHEHSKFIPCKSFQDAVDVCARTIDAKDHLCDSDVTFLLEHGLPLDEKKNAARIEKKKEYVKKQIAQTQSQVAKFEAELESIC